MFMVDLLVGGLKAVGRHKDAAEVEARWGGGGGSKSDDPAPPPCEAEGERESGGGSVSVAVESANAPKPAAGAEAGAASSGSGSSSEADAGSSSSSSGSSSGSSAASAPGADHADAPEAPAEALEAGPEAAPTDAPVPPSESAPPPVDLAADPLAGVFSDHMRESITKEAFASASGEARDSATAAEAAALRAAAVLTGKIRIEDIVWPDADQDFSPAAHRARIDALGGAIPDWVKGNPDLDPALIKKAERRAEIEARNSAIESAAAAELRAALADGTFVPPSRTPAQPEKAPAPAVEITPAPASENIAGKVARLAEKMAGIPPARTPEPTPETTPDRDRDRGGGREM